MQDVSSYSQVTSIISKTIAKTEEELDNASIKMKENGVELKDRSSEIEQEWWPQKCLAKRWNKKFSRYCR